MDKNNQKHRDYLEDHPIYKRVITMVTNQLLSRMILQVQAKSLCKFHGSMAPGVFSYNMVL